MTSWGVPGQYSFLLDKRFEGLKKEIRVPTDVMKKETVAVTVVGGLISFIFCVRFIFI